MAACRRRPGVLATLIETLPAGTRPHVAVIDGDGEPTAMLVGRIEETRLPVAFGYRTVFRPRVRILTVAHGGFGGGESAPARRSWTRRCGCCGIARPTSCSPARPSSQGLAAPGRGVFPPRVLRALTGALSLRTHRRLDLPGAMTSFFAAAPSRRARASSATRRSWSAISARSSACASGRRPPISTRCSRRRKRWPPRPTSEASASHSPTTTRHAGS